MKEYTLLNANPFTQRKFLEYSSHEDHKYQVSKQNMPSISNHTFHMLLVIKQRTRQ